MLSNSNRFFDCDYRHGSPSLEIPASNILPLVTIQVTITSKMRHLIWFKLVREKPSLT